MRGSSKSTLGYLLILVVAFFVSLYFYNQLIQDQYIQSVFDLIIINNKNI